MTIEVRVGARGRVRDGEPTLDDATSARCDLCGEEKDVVVSVAREADGAFGCKDCLRSRLEATTVASWLLREPKERGLPWGKISG